MTIYAYARTSTEDQLAGLEAQIRDLRAAGAEKIVSEQVSSVAKRDGLDACLAALRPGDVLMVTKPCRLARNTATLLEIVEDLTKRDIGLIIQSMGGHQIDTRNPTSKLILTILAGVSAWEREIMLERQKEGIAKARAEGKFRGRKASIDPAEVQRLVDEFDPTEAARRLGIHRASVYRLCAADTAKIQRRAVVEAGPWRR